MFNKCILAQKPDIKPDHTKLPEAFEISSSHFPFGFEHRTMSLDAMFNDYYLYATRSVVCCIDTYNVDINGYL